MDLESDQKKRMELEDRKEASLSAGPLASLLLLPTKGLCMWIASALSFSIENVVNQMNNLQQILEVGEYKEIEDNKDFNHFLHLLLELIYGIQHFYDNLKYDLIQPRLGYLRRHFQQTNNRSCQWPSDSHKRLQFYDAFDPSSLKDSKYLSMNTLRSPEAYLLWDTRNIPEDPTKLKYLELWKNSIGRMINEIYLFAKSLPPPEQLRSRRANKQLLLSRRKTFPYLEDSVAFGREKEKKKILDWLSPGNNTSNHFSTIAIVGQGGFGKTTLAQLVFNDDWVSKYFDLRMWVYVSCDFIVGKIMREMRDCVDGMPFIGSSLFFLDDDPLEFDLLNKLKGKKIMLVLDDVWNENPSPWENLKKCLLAAEYIRVIVTTRNVSVAEIMQTTDPVRLSYLSKENSLEILKQCAFQHHSPEKLPGLMDMGKRIVKKCGGLPLAIKALATYLRFKQNAVDGIDAIPNEVLLETIFPNLKISYDHLPIHLKCCFIHCSMFPEYYSFTKDELVGLWIAQGYITVSVDAEGTANNFFEKLCKTSFFHFSHCKANAVRVFTCPVLIHALAKHIAGNEYLALDELQDIPKNVRHLYVGSGEIIKHISPATAMALLTFVLHATSFHRTPDFILGMTRVRALVLIMHNVNELPGQIGNVLKPLRYLRVESYLMEKLPESIVNLFHLQVLDLSYCHKLNKLPGDIGRLMNLRTLCLNGCTSIQELPTTVGDLFVLQNLHLVGSTMKWMPPVIRVLTDLTRLHYRRI